MTRQRGHVARVGDTHCTRPDTVQLNCEPLWTNSHVPLTVVPALAHCGPAAHFVMSHNSQHAHGTFYAAIKFNVKTREGKENGFYTVYCTPLMDHHVVTEVDL